MSAKSQQRSFDQIAAEFRKRNEELSEWTLRNLTNRLDAYVWYLPLKRRTAERKLITVRQMPTLDVVRRHHYGASPGDLIGLHSTSHCNTCRWIAIDLDCHEDNPELGQRNFRFAVSVATLLIRLGFQPLVLDSDGRGGFHILVLFSEAVDSRLAYRFAKWLIRGWETFGIGEPETFPKQPSLGKGMRYGCALRVPGRHHTRMHWTRVMTPAGPRVGTEACDLILATRGAHPSLIPTEAREYQTMTEMLRTTVIKVASSNSPRLNPAPALPAEVLHERARRYLQKVPPAIQGQRGDERLWKTACLFLRAFPQFTPDNAFYFLREWNQRCQPPFDEAVLWSKINRASRKVLGIC